jgi:hypothetical protein
MHSRGNEYRHNNRRIVGHKIISVVCVISEGSRQLVLPRTYCNIVLLSIPRSSKWCAFLFFLMLQTPPISLCHLIIIIFGKEYKLGACVSVVGWGTVLQTGRLRVQFLMRSLEFSLDLNLPAALSTRNLPGDKERPAPKADKPHRHLWPDCLENGEPWHLTTLWASTAF